MTKTPKDFKKLKKIKKKFSGYILNSFQNKQNTLVGSLFS